MINLKMNDEVKALVDKLDIAIQPYLVENFDYMIEIQTCKSSCSGGEVYCINDEEENKRIGDLLNTYPEVINEVNSIPTKIGFALLNKNMRVQIRCKKGCPIIVQAYEPIDFINRLRQCVWNEFESSHEKIIHTIRYTNYDIKRREVYMEVENTMIEDGKPVTLQFFNSATLEKTSAYEYLFYSSGNQLKEVQITYTENETIVKADKEYPEWGIELLTQKEVDTKDCKKTVEDTIAIQLLNKFDTSDIIAAYDIDTLQVGLTITGDSKKYNSLKFDIALGEDFSLSRAYDEDIELIERNLIDMHDHQAFIEEQIAFPLQVNQSLELSLEIPLNYCLLDHMKHFPSSFLRYEEYIELSIECILTSGLGDELRHEEIIYLLTPKFK